MAPPPDKSRAAEPALWAFALSLVLLVGPARALWAAVICLGAWAVHRPSSPP